MTTQDEKVIVTADHFDLEQFAPDGCNALLACALRLLVEGGVPGEFRRRQTFAIELAVGCQRQALQGYVDRRLHVRRQARRGHRAKRL
ncbi:hypothetical protein, partial [Xanthomonas arboricola]|uniref:hypothetical protein n=1 Tax=Xanthomonas arboricola TaxID=56448 RepID=UPI001F40C9AE